MHAGDADYSRSGTLRTTHRATSDACANELCQAADHLDALDREAALFLVGKGSPILAGLSDQRTGIHDRPAARLDRGADLAERGVLRLRHRGDVALDALLDRGALLRGGGAIPQRIVHGRNGIARVDAVDDAGLLGREILGVAGAGLKQRACRLDRRAHALQRASGRIGRNLPSGLHHAAYRARHRRGWRLGRRRGRGRGWRPVVDAVRRQRRRSPVLDAVVGKGIGHQRGPPGPNPLLIIPEAGGCGWLGAVVGWPCLSYSLPSGAR